jgi:hypothetical protein
MQQTVEMWAYSLHLIYCAVKAKVQIQKILEKFLKTPKQELRVIRMWQTHDLAKSGKELVECC